MITIVHMSQEEREHQRALLLDIAQCLRSSEGKLYSTVISQLRHLADRLENGREHPASNARTCSTDTEAIKVLVAEISNIYSEIGYLTPSEEFVLVAEKYDGLITTSWDGVDQRDINKDIQDMSDRFREG